MRLGVEQRQQIVAREGRCGAGLAERCVGQLALSLLQLEDTLLDRILRHDPVYEDRSLLPDAMGAIRRLVFDGRDSTRGRAGTRDRRP